MTDFRISNLTNSAVLYLYSEKEFILLDPEYQRDSDIWSLEKKQLLIDSILNGYDIPKIYFHEFSPQKKIKGDVYKYAIIDGKQRISALWGFIDGEICLADDFEYLSDRAIKAGGLTYSELGEKYPKIKTKFDSTTLTVVTIQTDDLDQIEDMFSRLNEAVPLNAAEKRNAFGGSMPIEIRKLADSKFFSAKIPFENTRYKYLDLAAKFLYLEEKDGITDTKKVYLDEFVRSYKNKSQTKAQSLRAESEKTLSELVRIFVKDDPLLRSIGMVVTYYTLMRDARGEGYSKKIKRKSLQNFEKKREDNRILAEKNISKADYDLLEFDRLSQSPNDAVAMRFRFEVLKKFLCS
mgnify:CR=1 FL=1